MTTFSPAPLDYQPPRSVRGRRLVIATIVVLIVASSFLNGRFRTPAARWFSVRSSFHEMLRGGVASGTFEFSTEKSGDQISSDVFAKLDAWTRAVRPANEELIGWVRKAGGYSSEETAPFFLGRMRAADGAERLVRMTLSLSNFPKARLYLHVETFAVGTLFSPTFAVVAPNLQAKSRVMDIRGSRGPGDSVVIAELEPRDLLRVGSPMRRADDPSTIDLPLWFGEVRTRLSIQLAPANVIVIRRDDDQVLPIVADASTPQPAVPPSSR